MSETLFVVFEPKTELGDSVLQVFTAEEEAREAHQDAISTGLANQAVGQHLVRLDNVTAEQRTLLLKNTDDVLDEDFEGFEATYLDSFAASQNDWAEGSLGVVDEDFNASDDEYRVYN